MKLRFTIIYIACLSLWLTSFRQTEKYEGLTGYKVILSESSYLRIVGETNINCFYCDHEGKLPKDTLFVQANPQGNYHQILNSELEVKVAQFKCGLRQMTEDMMDLLDERNHPFLKVNILGIKQQGNFVEALTMIHIAGIGAKHRVFTSLDKQSNWTTCRGALDLNIADFGIEPPTKLFGAVRVKEVITIEFDLKIKIIAT